MKQEFHINVVTDKTSVVNCLAEETNFSKQKIKQIMNKGAVWLENHQGVHRIRRANKQANKDAIIHCYYNEKLLEQIPPSPKLIADELDYSVWFKPSGILCQGSKWGDHCTINRWIEQNFHFSQNSQRNCFIVHRLDKATSGLMLVAHTKSKAAELASLFKKRWLEKYYHAVVSGRFTENEILLDNPIDNKAAKTWARCISFNEEKNQSLLDVKIDTGRKHQIRIHLSQYGYPIIGDRLYGKTTDDDILLRAYSLTLFFDESKTQVKHYQLPEQQNLFI
ncbi:MAG: pseudouridine synthase family protein [Cellvibrionaceae bacterium]